MPNTKILIIIIYLFKSSSATATVANYQGGPEILIKLEQDMEEERKMKKQKGTPWDQTVSPTPKNRDPGPMEQSLAALYDYFVIWEMCILLDELRFAAGPYIVYQFPNEDF